MPSLNQKATRKRLWQLAKENILTDMAWQRAQEIAGYIPDTQAWMQFIDRVLLITGVVFALSGVFFFFAFNWSEMGKFTKFALIEVSIIVTILLTIPLTIQKLQGKLTILAGSMLVGVLLAVFGQTYQTGADSYRLFLNWALLITGWVLMSQLDVLWLIWVLLLNLTAIQYWGQVISRYDSGVYLILILLNGFVLFIWEIFQNRGVDWLQQRWIPRLITLITITASTLFMLQFIFEDSGLDNYRNTISLAPILWIVVLAIMLVAYYRWKADLLNLTLVAISIITTITSVFIRGAFDTFDDSFGMFFVIAIIILIQTGIALKLLTDIHERWEQIDG